MAATAGKNDKKENPPTILSIETEAAEEVRPDVATVYAGVITEAATAEKALAENAARMTEVIRALRQAGVKERDVQTAGLAVAPRFTYGKEGKVAKIAGYEAQNGVTALVRVIADIGKVVDAVVGQGANQFQGIAFGVAKPEALLDAARRKAYAEALRRAEIYAAAAGLEVERLMELTEYNDYAPPYGRRVGKVAMAVADGTPIEPGEVRLAVRLSAKFALR